MIRALARSLKKYQNKLNLLTDNDMVRKGKKGGICHAIHRYVKANNKYMESYDKHK